MPLCPICQKKESQFRFRPFCSKRCADVDLAKWMNNSYVVIDSREDESAEQVIDALDQAKQTPPPAQDH